MTWKPIDKTDGEVILEEIQKQMNNIRHPVTKRIFKSIPWKVRFRNEVKEYILDGVGIVPLKIQEPSETKIRIYIFYRVGLGFTCINWTG